MDLKKIFSILLICLVFGKMVSAQFFSIGPSAGLQHTWISDLDENAKTALHPGFNGGASMVFSTESHWGLGADLKYSLEGSKLKSDSLNLTTKWNTSYLRLPIRGIYFFGDYGNSVRPKVFLGPTLGYLLSSKFENTDFKSTTSSFDIGVHGGVGLNFKLMEAIWLNTDVTYTKGFLDVTQDTELSNANNLNGNVAINVGVLFGLR